MIQVRQSIFETNSSSVHSITMMLKEPFNRWERENLYLKRSDPPVLYTKEELISKLSEEYPDEFNPESEDFWGNWYDDFDEYLRDAEYYTYDNFGNDYEWFYDDFTTPSGETVVAFGYYGENR